MIKHRCLSNLSIVPNTGNDIDLWRPAHSPSPPFLTHIKLNSTCNGAGGEFWFSSLYTGIPFPKLSIMGTFYAGNSSLIKIWVGDKYHNSVVFSSPRIGPCPLHRRTGCYQKSLLSISFSMFLDTYSKAEVGLEVRYKLS